MATTPADPAPPPARPDAAGAARGEPVAAALAFLHQLLHRLAQPAVERVEAALARIGRQLFFGQNFKVLIEERVQALRAADVDPDGGPPSLLVLCHVLGRPARGGIRSMRFTAVALDFDG